MSNNPQGSRGRGCASSFPQPIDESEAERLEQTISQHNRGIVYRGSTGDMDMINPVFRWNTTHYSTIFAHGFQARPQGDTPNGTYFNLDDHVHHGGAPLDPNRPVTHAFVSTTLSRHWTPNPSRARLPQGGRVEVYRYEIFAPGGIFVANSLPSYEHPRQQEVAFVRGIAPQYIRSAQLYTFTRPQNSWSYASSRANSTLVYNRHFDPQSHPPRNLRLRNPVTCLVEDDGKRVRLDIRDWPHDRREKRDVSDWYSRDVSDLDGYINAAFRSSRNNEAYLFMRNEYLLVNYAPGTTGDRIVNGPLLICDGYPSLADTAFGEYGIDCAFDSHRRNRAFIFSGNLCAHIDYAPGTTNDSILDGPMTIAAMFPFFDGTEFASSIDAAFTATARGEAYLFKGDSYALINYDSKTCIATRKITQGFYSLRNTIFESGIEAAFASHRRNEAYIFKGDQYALINFAPGTTNDKIIGGVKPITPNWPSLRQILPRKNLGLDYHDHSHSQDGDHSSPPEHDELG